MVDKHDVTLKTTSRSRIYDSGKAGAVLVLLGIISLSCTDMAGAWSGDLFDSVALPLLACSAKTYWTARFIAEKSIHMILFSCLGATLSKCLGATVRRTACALIVGCGIGCSSELFQRLFPTRDPSIRDVLINWSAVVFGIGITHFLPAGWRALERRTNADAGDESVAPNGTSADLLALVAHVQVRSAAESAWEAERDSPSEQIAFAEQG